MINQLLDESRKSLNDFPSMPHPVHNWSSLFRNRLLLEYQRLEIEAQRSGILGNIDLLNTAQLAAHMEITLSVFIDKGTTFFLSGGA